MLRIIFGIIFYISLSFFSEVSVQASGVNDYLVEGENSEDVISFIDSVTQGTGQDTKEKSNDNIIAGLEDQLSVFIQESGDPNESEQCQISDLSEGVIKPQEITESESTELQDQTCDQLREEPEKITPYTDYVITVDYKTNEMIIKFKELRKSNFRYTILGYYVINDEESKVTYLTGDIENIEDDDIEVIFSESGKEKLKEGIVKSFEQYSYEGLNQFMKDIHDYWFLGKGNSLYDYEDLKNSQDQLESQKYYIYRAYKRLEESQKGEAEYLENIIKNWKDQIEIVLEKHPTEKRTLLLKVRDIMTTPPFQPDSIVNIQLDSIADRVKDINGIENFKLVDYPLKSYGIKITLSKPQQNWIYDGSNQLSYDRLVKLGLVYVYLTCDYELKPTYIEANFKDQKYQIPQEEIDKVCQEFIDAYINLGVNQSFDFSGNESGSFGQLLDDYLSSPEQRQAMFSIDLTGGSLTETPLPLDADIKATFNLHAHKDPTNQNAMYLLYRRQDSNGQSYLDQNFYSVGIDTQGIDQDGQRAFSKALGWNPSESILSALMETSYQPFQGGAPNLNMLVKEVPYKVFKTEGKLAYELRIFSRDQKYLSLFKEKIFLARKLKEMLDLNQNTGLNSIRYLDFIRLLESQNREVDTLLTHLDLVGLPKDLSQLKLISNATSDSTASDFSQALSSHPAQIKQGDVFIGLIYEPVTSVDNHQVLILSRPVE